MNLEKASIQRVIEFERLVRDRDAIDVSDDKTGEHNGYDVLSTDNTGQEERIEVKYTTTRTWEIPNAYETEYSDDYRLVADWLYVVVFHDGEVDSIHPIAQEHVNEHRKKHKEYRRLRFASSLQRAFRSGRFKAQ